MLLRWESGLRRSSGNRAFNSVGIYCLEGQGDIRSRLTVGIIRVTIWVIGVLTYLLSSPDPPSVP